jgi:hypothetical protein
MAAMEKSQQRSNTQSRVFWSRSGEVAMEALKAANFQNALIL